MKRPKSKALATTIPLNFLLGCSERSLGAFELARLAEAANLRNELHAILDRMLDEMTQAALAGWFRQTDRHVLKRAIEEDVDPVAWAQERVRRHGRSEEELVPLPSLPPGAAHLAAALRYQERNIAEGKCAICPKPLARHSVRYCEKHLAAPLLRYHRKRGSLGGQAGSLDYLYSDGTLKSTQGRQPGTLASLAMAREQRTRALLAEAGLTAESAAVSLKAAIEALMKCMPGSDAHAMTAAELISAAAATTSTGKQALKELLSAGQIQRIGAGGKGNPFRFFVTNEKHATVASAPSGLRSLAEKKRGRE